MYIKLHTREQNIVQIIVETLKDAGFHVFFNDFDVDIIALKSNTHTHVCPVECKISLDDRAIGQCLRYLSANNLPIINLAYYHQHTHAVFWKQTLQKFNLPINLVYASSKEEIINNLLVFETGYFHIPSSYKEV